MSEVNISENVKHATEIAFVFDTTGSMQPCIANVRKHIEKTCEELFKDIPNLKVGFISHGDYCDGDNCYKVQMLTDDQAKVFDFIRNAPNTSGGDQPECYELALNLAKTLGWSDNKGGKVLVMIGDADPHEVDYVGNKDRLDWKKELNDLKAMGINVYPLQCLYQQHATKPNAFWAAISELMGTPLLKLKNFDDASSVMSSFAFASSGSKNFAAYENKLELCGVRMSDEMKYTNAVLRAESTKYDVMEELPTITPAPTITPTPTIIEKKRRGRPKKAK